MDAAIAFKGIFPEVERVETAGDFRLLPEGVRAETFFQPVFAARKLLPAAADLLQNFVRLILPFFSLFSAIYGDFFLFFVHRADRFLFS